MQGAIKIIKKLQDAGHYALIVGGAVRDMQMGAEPKDYDLVTSCTPDQVEELFEDTIPVGQAFGITIVNKDYEVACFRADIYNPNEFSVELLDPKTHTLEELIEKDANRRDLTLNALYYDPIADKHYDPVNGMEDIKNRKLSFVGETAERIQEDPVRILRYFRFLFKHNLIPDQEDLQTIYDNKELLLNVSRERIFTEMTKLLLNINVWDKKYFVDLFIMLEPVFPDVAKFNSIKQPLQHHPESDVLSHVFYALKALRAKTPVTVWSCFLHDIGKVKDTKIDYEGKITSHGHDETGAVMVETILRDLKCSNKFIDEVTYIVRQHMRIKWASTMRKSKVIKLIKNEYYENLLEVSAADSMGAKGCIDWFHWIRAFEASDKCPEGDIIEPLVKGKDLIDLKMTPGPEFKSILKKALDLQLENPGMEKSEILLDITQEV